MIDERVIERRTRFAGRAIAISITAVQAWSGRTYMNPDGMSYLDVADQYLAGHWGLALNGYWSPLLSWLLGAFNAVVRPSPLGEAPAAHALMFLTSLGALVTFEYLLNRLLEVQDLDRGPDAAGAPRWPFLTLAYATFISTTTVIGRLVTPDLLVVAFVFLAAGLLVRLRSLGGGWLSSALFGLALGFGYLAKAVMFLVSLAFLLALFVEFRRSGWRLRDTVVAGAVFAIVAGAFVVPLSISKGRPTFGDSWTINYAWSVNGVRRPPYWQGEEPGSGSPLHATRKILDTPAVFEFATPIAGAYPPWYDPSYWYDGLTTRIQPRAQVSVLLTSVHFYWAYLAMPIVIVVALALIAGAKRPLSATLTRHWRLMIPTIGACALYALVSVESRYVAPFTAVLFLALVAGLSPPVAEGASREFRHFELAAAIALVFSPALGVLSDLNRELRGANAKESARVASVLDALAASGLKPGDKVAALGSGLTSYWARLAQLRIVAEAPYPQESWYWSARAAGRDSVHDAFRRTGARAIVAEYAPAWATTDGWTRVPGTDYLVRRLDSSAIASGLHRE